MNRVTKVRRFAGLGISPVKWACPIFISFGFCLAFDSPPGLKVEKGGNLSYAGARIRVLHFGPSWRMSAQGAQTVGGELDDSPGAWRFRGTMLLSGIGKTVSFTQDLIRSGPQQFDYIAALSSPEPIPTQQLALSVELPVWIFAASKLVVDGTSFPLTEKPLGKTFVWDHFSKLVCPTPLGRLVFSGKLAGQLQDGRDANGDPFFRLRFYFNPESGGWRSSQIHLSIETQPYGPTEEKPTFSQMGSSLVADAMWSPLTNSLCPVSNSILDWSGMNAFKAGGPRLVVSAAGPFEMEGTPGVPLRLFGANICDRANFLVKSECEQLASQLARQGYNAVRLHHYDRHLVAKGKTLAAGWDTQALDQLDYLFACLKRAGFFITIDLYTLRPVLAGEIREMKREVVLGEFKALVAISPSARSNWMSFAERLLNHVNPYTGLPWKADPALFGICLLNENATISVWDSAPDIATLYRERYADWLDQRKQAPGNDSLWARFLVETHLTMLEELKAFVKGLGTKALVTDANFGKQRALSLVRQRLDYVDNHEYFDLRQFIDEPFRLPYRYSQKSATGLEAQVPRSLFSTRLVGLPFTVTEFNYCYPNHERAEGGALMGAYAAFQAWDGVFRYAYSHAPERAFTNQSIFYLDNVNDPINMLADRIAGLLFTRGDVRPGVGLFVLPVSEACLDLPNPLDRISGAPFIDEERMGLLCRMGTGLSVPVGARTLVSNSGTLVSDTQELNLNPTSGQFSVVTPKTECFVLPGGKSGMGQFCTARNQEGFSVFCISAVDGGNLRTSKRLILFHLTDVQNSEIKFLDPNHTILGSWGRAPLLVRRGRVEVTLHGAPAGAYRLRAIQLDGSPGPEQKILRRGNEASFSLSTVGPEGNFLVYEMYCP